MSQVWSWLLASGGLLVFWLAGNRNRWTWHVALAIQGAWFAYGIVSRQWGFLVSSLAFSVVAARNLRKARARPGVDTQVRGG